MRFPPLKLLLRGKLVAARVEVGSLIHIYRKASNTHSPESTMEILRRFEGQGPGLA